MIELKEIINFKKELIEFKNIFNGFDIKQIYSIFIIPLVSMVIFFLPLRIQSLLRLNFNSPFIFQFLQFFSSSFTHKDFDHLFLNNILLYVILISLVVFMSLKIRKVSITNKLLIFTIISLPIISGIIKHFLIPSFFPETQTFCGASELVSAVLGFIPILWIKTMDDRSNSSFYLMVWFMLYLALTFAWIYTPQSKITILTLFSILVVYSVFRIREIWALIKNQFKMGKNFLFFCLTSISITMFILAPKFLFPVSIKTGFAHYIGVIYGVPISYLFYFRIDDITNLIRRINWGKIYHLIGHYSRLSGFLGIILCLLIFIQQKYWNILKPNFLYIWYSFIFLSILGFVIYYSRNPPIHQVNKDKIYLIIEKYLIFLLFVVVSTLINYVLFTGVNYKWWFIGVIMLSSFVLFYTIEFYQKLKGRLLK